MKDSVDKSIEIVTLITETLDTIKPTEPFRFVEVTVITTTGRKTMGSGLSSYS
jgi:hypothetical protein